MSRASGHRVVGAQDSDPVPGDLLGSGCCSEPQYIWGRLKRLEAWGPYPPRVESRGSPALAAVWSEHPCHPPHLPTPAAGPSAGPELHSLRGETSFEDNETERRGRIFFFFSSKIEENRKRFLRQEEVFLSQVELRGKKRERKKFCLQFPKGSTEPGVSL